MCCREIDLRTLKPTFMNLVDPVRSKVPFSSIFNRCEIVIWYMNNFTLWYTWYIMIPTEMWCATCLTVGPFWCFTLAGDGGIKHLRSRQIRNFMVALFMSAGTPMNLVQAWLGFRAPWTRPDNTRYRFLVCYHGHSLRDILLWFVVCKISVLHWRRMKHT